MRVIRHQAEVIQVSCNSFQHADHPRPVRTNKLCLGVCIGPKIHDHAFTTLQSLQPVNALSQHLNFRRQAGSDLGFRLRPFGFFLSRLNSNKGTKCDIEIRAARTLNLIRSGSPSLDRPSPRHPYAIGHDFVYNKTSGMPGAGPVR